MHIYILRKCNYYENCFDPWDALKEPQGLLGILGPHCGLLFNGCTLKIKIEIFTCLKKTLQDFASLQSSILTSNQAAQMSDPVPQVLGLTLGSLSLADSPHLCGHCPTFHLVLTAWLPSALQAFPIQSYKVQNGTLCSQLYPIYYFQIPSVLFLSWWMTTQFSYTLQPTHLSSRVGTLAVFH